MRRFGAYRIAAIILVLFCASHTIGGMLAQPSLGLGADTVFTAMKTVRFHFNGAECSWYGFWFGFGIVCSLFLALSAVMAWTLGGVQRDHWPTVAPIAWSLFAAHVANAVLDWIYFFPVAALTATLIAALLGVGAVRGSRALSEAAPR